MRALIFSFIFIVFAGVTFASVDSSGVGNNLKVMKEGKESKIDSVYRTDDEVIIYIDGVKIPAIQTREVVKPFPLPILKPAPVIKDSSSKSDTLVSVLPGAQVIKKASVNGGIPFLYYVIGLLVLGLIGANIYTKNKKKKSENAASEAVAPNIALNPADAVVPVTTTPAPDNRFVPLVDPDHAPAYPNMPSREELNHAALPNMLRSAYSRQNILNELGIITQVLETKFGRINGRFTMEHADGTRSVQEFQNEPGVKAKVRFSSGVEATVYSRFSCLNNIRALQVTEISQQPTFVEESRVEVTNNTTITTEFQPEPVPSEIVEVPVVETPVVPASAPAVVTVPVVPAEVQTSEPESVPSDDDPVVTATINGKQVTARLSTVKEFLK
jgi:hypothetical protein